MIYNRLDFTLDFGEFIIIFESCPVYTITPYINSVFRRDEPLSRKLLKDRLEGTGFYG